MLDLASGVLVVGLLATTGLSAAAVLRLDTLAEFALAAYLIAFGEVVLVVLMLSPFGAVERPALITSLAVACVVVLGIWWWEGRRLPCTSGLRRLIALFRRDRVLLPLGLVLTLAFGYTVALIVATAPNNGDSLAYHLARAAFWQQEGQVEYVPHTYDERINALPPNAEIVLTLMFEVTRSERGLGFIQLTSVIACAVAVFALARRLRCSEREAAFGAAIFLTLPTVLLQASTTKNDLVVAAPLLAAMVFLVGARRFPHVVLVALAVAVAMGTKVLAVFAIPLLLVVAVLARPTDHRTARLVALAVGTAVGSYWYAVNIAETGKAFGLLTNRSVIFHVQENVLTAVAFVHDSFDLAGAVNGDIFVYVLVGAALVVGSLVARRINHAESASLMRAGYFVAVIPFAVLAGSLGSWHVFKTLDDILDAPNGRLPVKGWVAPTEASESFSWFGPVGFLLVFASAPAAIVLVRRHSLSRLAVLLGLAPLVWLVFISASLIYDRSEGRYFIFPIALSASLWGLVLRIPSIAWATCAMGATTAVLSLIHFSEKPSGVRLFERNVPETIWGAERWRIHSVHRPNTPQAMLRFMSALPPDASVALALGYNDFGYPAFGPRLERHVELVPEGSNASESDTEWLFANPRRARVIDPTCWRPVVSTPGGWIAFRRTPCGS